MRILLRDPDTWLYFQSPANWTEDPLLAWDFESSLQALRLAMVVGLDNLEIVLEFEDADYHIRLPASS